MTDALAQWWRHEATVERFTGSEAYGDDFDAPETVVGFWADGTKLIIGPDGQQVTSTARFAFPIDAAQIPIKSRVTSPPVFGSRVTTVIVSAVGDGGGQPTPDHQHIELL